ncbi:MAG: signal peptidase I [Lentisphaeria bacterium]|nr:signal peptidase I [Lentisphaeria bacterium]
MFFKSDNQRKELKKFSKFLREVKHYIYHNDDILSVEKKEKLTELLRQSQEIFNNQVELKNSLPKQQKIFAELAPAPSCKSLRDWLDILAVGIAVAFGIRALFFQPFKIPTGSMQPTLFGIHYIEKDPIGNKFIGKTLPIVDTILFGSSRAYLKIEKDGNLISYRPSGIFGNSTLLTIGNYDYTLPGSINKIMEYTEINPYVKYQKNTVLADGFLSGGDHLFVDRISHYLVGLKRGDIVVFTTENIYSDGEALADTSGFYYVKRLVGLPGDTLKIVRNNLYVKAKGEKDFKHIKEFSPVFEKIYSGKGGYQGHSNIVGYSIGNFLKNDFDTFTVPEDSYFMLGDNTKFSADSRIWGVVPRHNIIGKASLVFYPFSRRFGIADRVEALDIETTKPSLTTYKEMFKQ